MATKATVKTTTPAETQKPVIETPPAAETPSTVETTEQTESPVEEVAKSYRYQPVNGCSLTVGDLCIPAEGLVFTAPVQMLENQVGVTLSRTEEAAE